MKKIIISFMLCTVCFDAIAEDYNLDATLRETYTNCVGIDDALHDMKVMAGINTAVTGIGTGLGIGATATGIAKTQVDKTIQNKFEKLKELTYTAHGNSEEPDIDTFLEHVKQRLKNTAASGTSVSEGQVKELTDLNNKAKKLGKWRTGLLVGNTATNVTNAVIAGTNKVKLPLQEQIENCKSSLKKLRIAINQAKLNGEDVTEAVQIESNCRNFEYVDITKINNRAKGSMISSIVGSGTGVVGIITSALANSDNVRKNDATREKNLNTTSNLLSAGGTVASATATIFNASQIKAIKETAEIASKCTEVLK